MSAEQWIQIDTNSYLGRQVIITPPLNKRKQWHIPFDEEWTDGKEVNNK